MLSMLKCCRNRITYSIQTKIVCRRYMTVSEKMEVLLKQRDNVPQHYKLIYRDKNHTSTGIVYHAIGFLTFLSVGSMAYMWYCDIPNNENAKNFSIYNNPMQFFIVLIGIWGYTALSLFIRKRYVLRMYFSERTQKYKTIFIGRIPFACEYYEFPPKSVTFAAPKDSAFPWRNVIFKIGKRKVYLFQDNFRTHSDFLNMLKPGEEFLPD